MTAGANKANLGPHPSQLPSRALRLTNTLNSTGTDHQRIAKLDRENEVAPPAKINPGVGKAIQTARMEKEMSQKELAQKVNEKPQVIADYEAGRAVPNTQVLGKLERALGVKLRGTSLFPFGYVTRCRCSCM